MQSAKVLA